MPFALTNRECLTARLNALGDAILTTGVLRYWHERAGLSFHVLTRSTLAPIFQNKFDLDGNTLRDLIFDNSP